MKFPQLTHVSKVREAIKDCKEFSETTRDGLVIFNYKFGKSDTFPDPADSSLDDETRLHYLIRRECRGLIFDAETGQLLARPYHKFFNVNELDETSEENINLDSVGYVLLEKLDGFFVSAILVNDQLHFASKTGISNKHSKQVESFVEKESNGNYNAFCRSWISRGYTPIFEFCSSSKQIVIKYKRTTLVLTGLRHRETGEYVKYEDMKLSAEESGIPVVHAWRLTSKDFQSMLKEIKDVKDSEGCVLRLDNGDMYKIKTLFYTNMGKGNSDLLAQEWQVWQLILKQKIDDVKSSAIQRALKNRISQFETKLYNSLQDTADRIAEETNQIRNTLPDDNTLQDFDKELAMRNVAVIERSIYRAAYSGSDTMQELIKVVAANSINSTKLSNIRYLANNIYFYQ